MPRYRRHFAPGQMVFLTLVCAARRPWLRDDSNKALVMAALRDTRAVHPFRHHGHVLLDDHLHLLMTPALGTGIPDLVGTFKRAVCAQVPEGQAGDRLWQRRYYDYVIRHAHDFAAHLDYLHFNQLKHGLVDHAAAWPWSSLPAWTARGAYPADWGGTAPQRMSDVEE